MGLVEKLHLGRSTSRPHRRLVIFSSALWSPLPLSFRHRAKHVSSLFSLHDPSHHVPPHLPRHAHRTSRHASRYTLRRASASCSNGCSAIISIDENNTYENNGNVSWGWSESSMRVTSGCTYDPSTNSTGYIHSTFSFYHWVCGNQFESSRDVWSSCAG